MSASADPSKDPSPVAGADVDVTVGADTETNADADANADTFDLAEKLSRRLREHQTDRERTHRLIDVSTTQLQHLFKLAPKRPREPKAALRDKSKRLERERTSRSLPLSQEKALIRQIETADRQCRMHDICEAHQEVIRRKKTELESCREGLRTTNAAVAEIETALAKVELAKRLGCSTSDLMSRDINCPVDKLGRVIGKNGANLKAIEEHAGAQIDVDKLRGLIHVRGIESAIDEAVKRLENLTLAIEEDMEVSSDVVTYILTQRSAVLNKIREDNPDVFIDVSFKSTKIHLRAHPDKLEMAKADLLNVRAVSKIRKLVKKESALVVGRTGATIHRISDAHGVAMELSASAVTKDAVAESSSTLRVVGLLSNVDGAMADVDELLFHNEDLEESIPVDMLYKNRLLNNSGAAIKEFQAEVNRALVADQEQSEASSSAESASSAGGGGLGGGNGGGVFLVFERHTTKDSPPVLLVRTIRANMPRALEVVRKKVDDFEAYIFSIDVAREIIPAVIGKGGAKINALRKEGLGAEVEADAQRGTVKFYSEDETTRDAIRIAVQQIVAKNQVGYVPIGKGTIGLVLGDPGKEMREEVAALEVNFGVDDSDSKLVIKGTVEQIAEASEIFKSFIAKNFVAEFEINFDDEPLLFIGGTSSILSTVEADHDVKAKLRKSKNCVSVRGEMEKVHAAEEAIKRFLYGGDGFAVCKLKVIEASMGGIIGKGGSNISKLETDFDGVRIHVPREGNVISIRGPNELVRQCRVRMITTIAKSRVNETVAITPQQHEELSKSDFIKRTASSTSVQIVLNENFVKIRGVSNNARDAKALLNEHLTGVYRGILELEALHSDIVKRTVTKDSSHFERIQLSTGTKVALEPSECSILITGKKSNVKKAKMSLMDFLEFLFPMQFKTVKVHKTFFKSIGDPGPLADIAAETGASVSLDRDMNCVLIRSVNSHDCLKAVELVNTRLLECKKLNAVLRFDTCDSWLLSVIIGKNGATINKLQTETGCSVEVLKDEVTVVISAESEESVETAKEALNAVVEKARKECVFVDIPESAMATFIGKGGAHIKQIAEVNEVVVERTKKQPTLIKITGEQDMVSGAKAAIMTWLRDWELSHVGLTVGLEEYLIPRILGKGGETIRAIQKDTSCKIDVDRQQLTLTVRDGRKSDREEVLKKINAIIEEEKLKELERAAVKEKTRQEQAENAVDAKAKGISAAKVSTDQHPEESAQTDGVTKDRSSEFASRPVGLTSFKKKGKHSSNTQPEGGSKAGRELFLMLISGNSGDDSSDQDDQWDSSTMSSTAAMASACGSNDVAENIQHYRSISGFTVRI